MLRMDTDPLFGLSGTRMVNRLYSTKRRGKMRVKTQQWGQDALQGGHTIQKGVQCKTGPRDIGHAIQEGVHWEPRSLGQEGVQWKSLPEAGQEGVEWEQDPRESGIQEEVQWSQDPREGGHTIQEEVQSESRPSAIQEGA